MARTILSVVGARPNFMKIAPILRALALTPSLRSVLVHTGQHYDEMLSQQFFRDLEIPPADFNLEVGSAGHGVQTGEIMKRLEPVVQRERPAAVLVVGDVNSTLAAALVAAKLHIPVVHVEAGLRSFDRRMPEEVNRVVTDVLSELLFVTEPAGVQNLLREGIAEPRIHLVGDVMIDSVAHALPRAREAARPLLESLPPGPLGVVTLHRPSNVDDPSRLRSIVDALLEVSHLIRLLFPIHPRTRERLERSGLLASLEACDEIRLVPPLGYLEFLGMLEQSRLALTDSGGIQAEAVFLRRPCLTLRDTTERPITVELGVNQLLGTDPAAIVPAVKRVLSHDAPLPPPPALMDGQAARRIVSILEKFLPAGD